MNLVIVFSVTKYIPLSAADDVGVFDPNMENVFDRPVRLFFMKLVAWDDDESSDDAMPTVLLLVLLVAFVTVTVVVIGLLTKGVVNEVVVTVTIGMVGTGSTSVL